MTEPVKLVMAELDAYKRVGLSEVAATARDGFAQYEVAVRRGCQVFHHYLNHEGGVWVPQIDDENATVAFGDTDAKAIEALRAQRLVIAEQRAQDLARFRETTTGLGVG